MIKAIISITGKSGSGKDLYANAISEYVDCDGYFKYGVEILQFALPLKIMASRLMDIPIEYFYDRDKKDAPIDNAYLERVLSRRNNNLPLDYQMFESNDIIDGFLGFSIRIYVKAVCSNIHRLQEAGKVTPRDILKLLGAYGGIVPTWTWLAAMRSMLDIRLMESVDNVIIISDLRTLEEYGTIQYYCCHNDIPFISFYLNHWNKKAVKTNHITEVDLDNQKKLFTKVLSPKKGEDERENTFMKMMELILPATSGEDEVDISVAYQSIKLAEEKLK